MTNERVDGLIGLINGLAADLNGKQRRQAQRSALDDSRREKTPEDIGADFEKQCKKYHRQHMIIGSKGRG